MLIAHAVAGFLAGPGPPFKEHWRQLCDLYDTRLLLLAWNSCGGGVEGDQLATALGDLPAGISARAQELWVDILLKSSLNSADAKQANGYTMQLEACLNSAVHPEALLPQVHSIPYHDCLRVSQCTDLY